MVVIILVIKDVKGNKTETRTNIKNGRYRLVCRTDERGLDLPELGSSSNTFDLDENLIRSCKSE